MSVKLKGIDVSGWQGKIDFKKVKASGVDFVIVKAGYSTNTSATWETHFANAKNNGLKVGAYWYSYAQSIEEAREEAKAFIKALEGKQLDFPVFLDMEEKSMFDKGTGFCTLLVEAFCGELEKAGYYAGVYCSTYWYTNYVEKSVREKRPAWIADYRSKCYYTDTCGIWQYGATTVPGVQYDCDVDWGYVDYSEYIKSHNLNNYKKTANSTAKKTVEQLAKEVINGLWGVGATRKSKLTAAGYVYAKVQAIVNEMLKPKTTKKSVSEIADEVIQGKWGVGDERYRKLTEAGYVYAQVQRAVNQKLYGSK